MIRIRKIPFLTIVLVMLVAGTLLAGGGREEQSEAQPDPTPDRRGDRIEFGREVEREPEQREERLGVWILADHELDQTLEREISTIMQQGYTPVGMERTEEGISVLYIRTETVVFDRWIIHEFADLSAINDEFSAFLVDGWLPMGFSKDGDSITTLFVRSRGTEIAGWRMHDLPAGEIEQLFSVVEAYLDRGYVPYGLSIDPTDNRIWLLVLETETAPGEQGRTPSVLINAFREADIVDGITSDINNGAIPWAMSRGEQASFFLYLF